MDDSDSTAIAFSRAKLSRVLVGCIAFVAGGVWMLTLDQNSVQYAPRYRDITYVHFIGWISIIFFGAGLIYIPLLFFNMRPAYVFDASGITIAPGKKAFVFIPWNEILGSGVYQQRKQKLLVVMLRDPRRFNAQGNQFRQVLRNASFKMCGSPVTLSTHATKIGFAELQSTFNRYFRKYA